MDDKNAILRLKQGDIKGLESLVQLYQAQALRAAYLILYDRSQAEDIVQAAFVKVAERSHQFDSTRPFAPWFYRIVVNDALKQAGKQKHVISIDESLDEPTQKLAQMLVDSDPNPEQMVEQIEIRQLILKAIQSLPPDQRAVVVMRYYLELSERDMSTRMGRPLSTIKWWLRDGRNRLRSLMETTLGGME